MPAESAPSTARAGRLDGRQRALHGAGLVLGIANAARHRLFGYRTPRPFNDRDAARAAAYDRSVVDRWRERGGVDFHGLAVLELGPGPDLGTGAFVLVEGAVTYCAVDQFPLAARSDAVLEYIRASLGVEFARDQIRYVLDDFPALGRVSGPFDAIVSNATLEHVNDIERLFRRLAELLRPGGIMCHHIDAKTHMRGFRKRDPLNIYRFSERIYRLLRFPGSPNRWLADDYASAARSAGFDIEVVPGRIAATEYLAATAPYLHPMYGDRSDLKYLTFTLNCRLRSQPRSVAISDSERPYIAQSESGSSKIGDDFDAAVGSSLTTSWSAGADARPAR